MDGNKYWKSTKEKIQSFAKIEETTKSWKATGEKIIFTNGCFVINYAFLAFLKIYF